MSTALPVDVRTRLSRLLLSAFDVSELRRLVRYMPEGEVLTYSLPSGATSPVQLVDAVIDAVERNGQVNDLLDAVRRERPRRVGEVDAVLGGRAPNPPASTPVMAATDPAAFRYDVFLAHSSADKPRVRALYELLRDKGVRTFFDEASLEPGTVWMREIPLALQSSQVIVVLVSRSLANAWYANNEVIDAIELAREGARTLVPVYLDGWLKPAPYGLASLHSLNASDIGLEAVAERLRTMIPASPAR